MIFTGILAAPPGASGAGSSPGGESARVVLLLEAVEAAAASGAYPLQNTATLTTGRIREDDKKRSAIAFAISGAGAFVGAFLWRWLPCRNAREGSSIGGLSIVGYNKCYTDDGERKGFDTPTKLMLGAGVGLEVVSLLYLVAHLRDNNN